MQPTLFQPYYNFCVYELVICTNLPIFRVATHLENVGNLETSGNLRVVREKSGEKGKVRESVFLHMVNYREY